MLEKIEGRRRGWRWMRWLNGIMYSVDTSLSKLLEMVKAREALHAADHGVAKSQTQLSNWTTTINTVSTLSFQMMKLGENDLNCILTIHGVSPVMGPCLPLLRLPRVWVSKFPLWTFLSLGSKVTAGEWIVTLFPPRSSVSNFFRSSLVVGTLFASLCFIYLRLQKWREGKEYF